MYLLYKMRDTHTQPFNGLWSRTTRVGRYQKKHSPTRNHPDKGHPLSSSSNDPLHPLCSFYVLDSPIGQPLSRFSLVFRLVFDPQNAGHIWENSHWFLVLICAPLIYISVKVTRHSVSIWLHLPPRKASNLSLQTRSLSCHVNNVKSIELLLVILMSSTNQC